MGRGRQVLRLICVVCLLLAGLVLGQTYFGSRHAPPPATAAPAEATGAERMTDVEPPGPRSVEHVPEDRGSEDSSRIGLALASVGDQLVELWERVLTEELAEPTASSGDGLLAEVALWGGTARLRTTYDMVDLDSLRERIASRDAEPVEKMLGLSGELSIADVGSIRVGYRVRPELDERYVRVADAEVEYRLGNRTTVAADVMWGIGTDFDHAAGLNVQYQLAPHTSLQAGYHLLNFGDLEGKKEQHSAGASLQLRF